LLRRLLAVLLGLLTVLLLLTGLLAILLRGLLLLLTVTLGLLLLLTVTLGLLLLLAILLLLGLRVILMGRSILWLLTVLLRGLAVLLLGLTVGLGTTLHGHTEHVHCHSLVVLRLLLLRLTVNRRKLGGLMSSHDSTENVGGLACVCLCGFPVTFQVKGTTFLTLVLKVEPLVHATVHAEARNLHDYRTDQV
jgi:hypothetical protein